MASGAAVGNRRAGRLPLGPQIANLPHRYNRVMYIRVNQRDNVGIIVDPEGVAGSTGEWIPQSHKIALCQLEAGQPVLRYGQNIGFANRTLQIGRAHV